MKNEVFVTLCTYAPRDKKSGVLCTSSSAPPGLEVPPEENARHTLGRKFSSHWVVGARVKMHQSSERDEFACEIVAVTLVPRRWPGVSADVAGEAERPNGKWPIHLWDAGMQQQHTGTFKACTLRALCHAIGGKTAKRGNDMRPLQCASCGD